MRSLICYSQINKYLSALTTKKFPNISWQDKSSNSEKTSDLDTLIEKNNQIPEILFKYMMLKLKNNIEPNHSISIEVKFKVNRYKYFVEFPNYKKAKLENNFSVNLTQEQIDTSQQHIVKFIQADLENTFTKIEKIINQLNSN